MDKDNRNAFYIMNKRSIDKIISHTIATSKHNDYFVNYLKGRSNSSKDKRGVANIHINIEDIEQQLTLEILIALEEKESVNLSYIKKLSESRLKNILRRYNIEQKHSLAVDDFEKLSKNLTSTLEDYMTDDLYATMLIEKTMLRIKDPLARKYLKILAGNLSFKGYEEFAIRKNSKAVSDDRSIALELGFDSPKRSKYCKIKRTVEQHLSEVIKSMDDVA